MLFEQIKLEEDERVLSTVRRHWFIVVSELIMTIIVTLLPLLLLLLVGVFFTPLLPTELIAAIEPRVILFSIILWLLICLLAGFTIWTNYYLDVWLITDRRIILVDQKHYFNRNVAIFRLERLQDIEFSINGLLPTLLNFGTLSAQTAGQHEHNFQSAGMPDPRRLQSLIQQAVDKRLKELHVRPDQMD